MTYDPTALKLDLDPTSRTLSGVTWHGSNSFSVPFISQITDDLWMGGCASDLVLPQHITSVVSLYPWEAYTVHHDLNLEMHVRMYDDNRGVDRQQVTAIATMVNLARRKGPTLVHCQAGLNRSGLISALALVLDGMPKQDAIKLLRQKRSHAVLCNKSFEQFILSY